MNLRIRNFLKPYLKVKPVKQGVPHGSILRPIIIFPLSTTLLFSSIFIKFIWDLIVIIVANDITSCALRSFKVDFFYLVLDNDQKLWRGGCSISARLLVSLISGVNLSGNNRIEDVRVVVDFNCSLLHESKREILAKITLITNA